MKMDARDAEKRTILRVADLMAAAARTAPKACGTDHLEVYILTEDDKNRLGEEMKKRGTQWGQDFIVRDGGNVIMAEALVLMGALIEPMQLEPCSFCGFSDCGDNAAHQGICSFNTVDLGIAIGSAVSVAADHRIDNRVLFSAGKVALEMGLFPKNVRVAFGIPLYVSSKSPFFDRESGNTVNSVR